MAECTRWLARVSCDTVRYRAIPHDTAAIPMRYRCDTAAIPLRYRAIPLRYRAIPLRYRYRTVSLPDTAAIPYDTASQQHRSSIAAVSHRYRHRYRPVSPELCAGIVPVSCRYRAVSCGIVLYVSLSCVSTCHITMLFVAVASYANRPMLQASHHAELSKLFVAVLCQPAMRKASHHAELSQPQCHHAHSLVEHPRDALLQCRLRVRHALACSTKLGSATSNRIRDLHIGLHAHDVVLGQCVPDHEAEF